MRYRVRIPFAVLAVATSLACASSPPIADDATARRADSVPATAPNFQPPDLADDLVVDAAGDRVSTTVLSVLFEADATQAERQAAVDAVDATVIGGVNVDGDGWYYVRVEQAGSIDEIYRVAGVLAALPQVTIAAPYIEFGT
jgi:hypothetical protein